jgi:hypothetical protein
MRSECGRDRRHEAGSPGQGALGGCFGSPMHEHNTKALGGFIPIFVATGGASPVKAKPMSSTYEGVDERA